MRPRATNHGLPKIGKLDALAVVPTGIGAGGSLTLTGGFCRHSSS